MERVVFQLEDSDVRLACLLNPESLVIKRRAGVRSRSSSGNIVTGASMKDDSLIYTGGGSTWLDLDLLFDVTIAGSSITHKDVADVRDLTRPLWNLAENRQDRIANRRLPRCLFFWGTECIITGVVTAVAERLEYFTAEGVPRRSWLRLRLVRVDETVSGEEPISPPALSALELFSENGGELEGDAMVHEVLGSGPSTEGDEDCPPGERLDQIAYRYLGDPSRWRELAIFNNIDDPFCMAAGLALEIPAALNKPTVP